MNQRAIISARTDSSLFFPTVAATVAATVVLISFGTTVAGVVIAVAQTLWIGLAPFQGRSQRPRS